MSLPAPLLLGWTPPKDWVCLQRNITTFDIGVRDCIQFSMRAYAPWLPD